MRLRNSLSILALLIGGSLASTALAQAAGESTRARDEKAVRAAAKEYIGALKRNDARAMHDMWLAEGDIVDEFGRARPAHEVIDREIQTRVADATGDRQTSTVSVIDNSIRFLTDDVAIEDGRVSVSNGADEPPVLRGRFTAIWVKQDGDWRLASLREAHMPTSTASDLAALDWMVGNWTGQVGKSTLDVTTHWNEKRTLLHRDLIISRDGQTVFSGEQRVGVDPLDGRIKSWFHDSDGGRGEGIWNKQADGAWVVQATGVTPDGRRTSATNVYTLDGKDQITWKSTGGFAEGKPVPDFEVTLKREPADDKGEAKRPSGRDQ